MRKIILAVCLCTIATASFSQNYNVKKEITDNPRKTWGMEMPYDFDIPVQSAAPRSYKPFYISHYGRHGSRYAWSTAFYTVPVEVFTKAHTESQLTALGEKIYSNLIGFYEVPLVNMGDLVPLGWEQHEKIAAMMYDSFPEVFRGKARIEAVVSTSPRAIVSMSSFCLSLKGRNPKLQFYQSSTHTGMMAAAPSSAPSSIRESYKGFETNPVEGWESRSEFGNRICDYRGICARLFKDPDYPDQFEGGKHNFIYHLFGLVCGYHNYEPRPLFDDIFTAKDMADVWETNNYSSFLYDIDNRWLNIPLLKDIIAKADKAICSKGNAADLRFGHDYVIEAFNVLINVNGSSTIPANADEVKYWMQSYTIPKAANDQFIFYRSGKKNAPVLFKLLLNGKEAVLPQLEAVSGPYYKWDDFKAWADELLSQHPLLKKGN